MARPKVILFVVNETLLDLQPMKEAITTILGGGPETARLWFTTGAVEEGQGTSSEECPSNITVFPHFSRPSDSCSPWRRLGLQFCP